ncbi:hypothetical protein DSECCO2_314520 [anaerobic digester metagenome]
MVALFQLKFNSPSVKLSDFLAYDTPLRHNFPLRRDNIQVGLDLENSSIPLGVSKIRGTSDAKIGSYVYSSVEQKIKLEISENTITFIDERPYTNWNEFKNKALDSLMILADALKNVEISRTSIRFINRFTFKNFDNPQEYFNVLISSGQGKDLPYPLRQYGFRLLMEVPDTDIHSIVNQNVESSQPDLYFYTFDIDVLDKQHLIFDRETLSMITENLREVKNQIFFNNVTQKTLDLCS